MDRNCKGHRTSGHLDWRSLALTVMTQYILSR